MSSYEKCNWLFTLVGIWGLAWLALAIPALLPGPALDDGWTGFVRGLITIVGVCTALYLLVLSWRSAYLFGRRQR